MQRRGEAFQKMISKRKLGGYNVRWSRIRRPFKEISPHGGGKENGNPCNSSSQPNLSAERKVSKWVQKAGSPLKKGKVA